MLDQAKKRDARCTMKVLSFSEDDSTFGKIVWREFNAYLIARNDSNEVFSHFPSNVREHLTAGFQLDAESCICQCLGDRTLNFECFFVLCHKVVCFCFFGGLPRRHDNFFAQDSPCGRFSYRRASVGSSTSKRAKIVLFFGLSSLFLPFRNIMLSLLSLLQLLVA